MLNNLDLVYMRAQDDRTRRMRINPVFKRAMNIELDDTVLDRLFDVQ